MEVKNKIFKCPLGHEKITQSFTEEIYSGNEYDRFGIKVEKGDIVLDAGANVRHHRLLSLLSSGSSCAK